MVFLYDKLGVVSEIDTQFVVIAVNEGLYTGVHSMTTKRSTLSMNYPNPFTDYTTIEYSVGQLTPVLMEVFDVNGLKVKTLADIQQQTGEYKVVWNGKDDSGQRLPGGIYLYRIKTKDTILTKRCVLLR